MANTTNTTSYLDPPSLIGRQNNDGTISLTPLELKRLNDFNYAVSKMIQGGLNLANLNADTNQVFTDIEGNVTTLQTTAAGLQSSVASADGKATTALQTANGVQVDVNGLKSRNTVTIDSTGLYVTDAAGNTTKLSGNHITSGTIEGVTLLSKSGNYSVKIEDAQVTLASPSGGGYVKADSSGVHVFGGSVDGPGVSIDCNGGSFALDSAWQKMDATKIELSTGGIMKLNAGSNASIDASNTIYIGASSGYSGNVNIGQSGGTINLNGTVKNNGNAIGTAVFT